MEIIHPTLEQLQQRLGYAFRDPRLLECALTHTSYLQDHPAAGPGNQRLEFLGDSVLQLIPPRRSSSFTRTSAKGR